METTHTCPPWIGRLMVSPLRKLMQNPEHILDKYIQPGMQVLEIGPGMGFFSIPMAKQTGPKGKVYCIDVEQKMLDALNKRAHKARVGGLVETRVCSSESLEIDDLKEQIDFVLLFAVVHEVPNQTSMWAEVASSLRKGGKVLFSEPKGHVKPDQFHNSISIAESLGIMLKKSINIRGGISVLLEKV